jgi:hypothetical protein
MLSKYNINITGIPLRKVFSSLHPMQNNLGLRALGMHSTASPTRIGGCSLVKTLIPLRQHQKWLGAPWWNTALTWAILSYLTPQATWLRYVAPDLAQKGSNRHARTIPSRKHRLASLVQSQKPLIDSLKHAGRHFSPPGLSLPPKITLLYLHLSQRMCSVSSPSIHLP